MKKKLPLVKYSDVCPIDEEKASFDEIFNKGICRKDFLKFRKNIWEIKNLKTDPNNLINFKENYLLSQQLKLFINFFRKNFNYQPLKLQLYWAKRALKKESFSIIAPTGIGKTTFGVILSHFFSGKVYYLVPSKILIREIENKMKLINSNKKILVIKEKNDKNLLNNNFDILVTTANFLHRNFDYLPKNFDLVFIDDADSLIRQPRNIDKILKLINFNDEEIEKALKIIDQKRKARSRDDYNNIETIKFDKKQKGSIIAASATLSPRTKRVFLFRELLNFEIGSSTTHLRNIAEIYKKVNKNNLWRESIVWIKKLGRGGFIFLSDDFNKENLNDYLEILKKNKIEAISYEKFTPKNKNLFLNDKIDVIVGFSNIRNPLTRGIDLPTKVRYALFVGVPKFRLPLKSSYSPLHLFLLGLSLREVIEKDEQLTLIEKNLNFLKKISFLKEEQILADNNLKQKLEPLKQFYDQILADKNTLLKKVKKHPRLSIEINNDLVYLIVSDPRGYLQASGRTSRLFPLGLTKGLSLILVEDLKVLEHLKDKLKILGYDPNFQKNNEVDFKKIISQVDHDRELVKKVQAGEEFAFHDPIETILFIVESPTKAKTIANFFGKPARRLKNRIIFYEVSLGNLHLNICATLGHFTDLVHKKYFYGVAKEKNNFIPLFQLFKTCSQCQRHLDNDEKECPVCKNKNFTSKKELIEILREAASEVDRIYLATDPDAEGEKIAFDLFAYLYPYNKNIHRVKLHEITRAEFLRKIKNPENLDLNLVKSQLLRRISDRWIGFSLSEDIQKHFKNLNLSAGRVQTPVLRWILDKEKRIKNKHYQIKVIHKDLSTVFFTSNEEIIKKIKSQFKNNKLILKIKSYGKKIETINPLPAYETSEILKDAFSFFRFDTETTMKLAQELFEYGLITYHRTDSIFISDFGQNVAKEYLQKKDLNNLLFKRHWGVSGTHEAIRPTRPLDVQDLIEEAIINGKKILTKKHLQLYGLIFNRFLSSQMKPSQAKKSHFVIKLANLTKKETVFTEILKENHLKYFRNLRVSFLKEGIFPVENLQIKKVSKEFHYTQGQIIDEMKKRGLGRPSTYSLILRTLLERKYIINRSGYIIPTSWGEKIYDYLYKKYSDLISEKFTIKLEKTMDFIAEGKINYQNILNKTFQRIF